MRTTRRVLCAMSISLASILALSCDNSYGVFSNVQQEKAQAGTTVFQKTMVSNAFSRSGKYFAATATLNSRPVSTKSWAKVAIVSSTYFLRSAVLLNNATIYALIDTGGSQQLRSSPDGDTWTSVALPAGVTFDTLFAAGTQLFGEAHAYNAVSQLSTYTLYNLTGSALVTGFSPATDRTIRGVVWDGAKYWFASEDLLWSGTSAAATTDESPSFTTLASKTIWGLSATASYVYITTTDGTIYRNGTAAGLSTGSIPLGTVIEVPAAASTHRILVGSDTISATGTAANGYYESNADSTSPALFTYGFVTGDAGAVTLSSAVYSTTVNTFPVRAFYFDAGANKLFVCIAPGTASAKNYGLYSSDWDGSTWSGWSAE